ncbi:alpha/beta hydrolase [Pelagicoccus mobilis]
MFSKTQPDSIVEYKETAEGKLTLHIFNPPGHRPTDSTPAIVFFFGGGWKSGDPSHFYRQSEYLASRGLVAICADYRTATRHGTTPQACVKDGKSAIRWVRAHAAELGIAPDRIAAGGGSAGGHVAAATATLAGFNEEGEDTTISCRPDALALFNPVFDNSSEGYGFDRVKDYWRDFSPLHNIGEQTPPTIVFLGTNDHLVKVSSAESFKKQMEANQNRCELLLFEGHRHGFFNEAKYYETLLETDKFLTSLGYLNGKPTLKKEES